MRKREIFQGIIYMYTSPSGNSYIGQTMYPYRRLAEHRRKAKNGCRGSFYNAIRKYGFDSFKYTVLYTSNEKDKVILKEVLNQMEVYYITLYDTFKHGYNSTIGGESVGGENHPCYGTHLSEEHVKKLKNSTSKVCSQYDMNGNYIATYPSVATAARTLGYNPQSISIATVCRGDAYTSIGFQWRYGDDKENIGPPNIPKSKGPLGYIGKLNGRSKPVYQYSLDGKLVHSWESSLRAQYEGGYDSSVICRAIKNVHLYGHKQQPKFFWSFELLTEQEVLNIINTYYEWTKKFKAKKGTSEYYLRDIRKPRTRQRKKEKPSDSNKKSEKPESHKDSKDTDQES